MQNELFRVISWNLGGAPVAGGTSLEQQRMAWDRLRELEPDLVLLQEVQADGIPSWETEGWTILQGAVGRHAKQYRWGSVIAAKRELQPRESDDVFADRGLQILYDYILAGQVYLPEGRDVLVATVHTPAKEVQEYLNMRKFKVDGLPSMDELRRRGYPNGKPWLNDLAFRCLQRQTAGRRFIIGGDWNTARGFGDEGAAFFRRAEAEAWTDCHWVKNHKEVRTFLRKGSEPYQDDHLFCDQETGKRLLACRVIAEEWVGRLSDHAPLIAEFSTAEGVAELTSLWTAREAAKYLGMGESSFRSYAFDRRVPYYRIGGYFRSGIVRFHPEDVRRWGRMYEAGKEEWIEMTKAIDGGKDKLMTIEELAEFLSISRYTLYNWTSTRNLPFYKIGRTVRFRRKDIEAWLEKQKVEQFRIKERYRTKDRW